MELLRRLRKKVGYLKWYYLQQGYKKDQHLWELQRLDADAARRLDVLPPIPLPERSDTQVHLLCGHKHLSIGVWSLWSLLHWAGEPLSVVFHSDGSITEADAAKLRRFFPGVHLPDRAATERTIERELAGPDFEHLRRFRATHVLSPKLLDAHLWDGARGAEGAARTILLFDTDILVYARPDEVLRRCAEVRTDGTVSAFVDSRHAYVADPDVLTARTGTKVADRLNSGLVVMPRFGRDDFRLMERCLRAFEPDWLKSHFAEQTLYGILAGERGWRPLSGDYQIGPGTPDAVAVHYVSGVRRRFYAEGIPRLLDRVSSLKTSRQATAGTAPAHGSAA